MKYTKEQRHEIYIKALDDFKEKKSNCICWALAHGGVHYNYDIYGITITEFMKAAMPEFSLFDPETYEPFWGFETSKHRETVLEFCIEMTKPTKP